MSVIRQSLGILLCLLLSVEVASADVRLPAVFNDNMVLQRDKRVPVWGTAAPGEQVTVRMRNNAVSATANAEGKWRLDLPPMTAGGPFEFQVSGRNQINFKNVLVGEVWVCSGQTNMQFPLQMTNTSKPEVNAAYFPRLRLLHVKLTVAGAPQTDFVPRMKWSECTPESATQFSAVAFYFGRDLHQKLDVPVGLILATAGGTICEAWTSRTALESVPAFTPILAKRQSALLDAQHAREQYPALLREWEARAAAARATGRVIPRKPLPPRGPDVDPNYAANLFNGMIAPLIPYAIRGTIWYQGEANVVRAHEYRKLFRLMISDWRKQWGQGDFPFYFVQFANFQATKTEPVISKWAELREAQALTLKSVSKTGMAVTIDIGDPRDIMPRNKLDVGLRLSRLALARDYGQSLEDSGPVYRSMSVVGKSVRLNFGHAERRLRAGRSDDESSTKITGFTICGADRQFVRADAVIAGESVLVSSPAVSTPVAVRYAWADNPAGNLYNGAGLPASPFRTDSPDQAPENPTLYALLVGCSKYDETEFRSLKYTRNDIAGLYDTLRSAGYAERNIVLMHEERPVDFVPDSRKVRKQLQQLLVRLRPDDSVIIAFAGHGVQFEGEKQNYFCPRDARVNDRDTLISLDEVYKQLDACRARRRLLLVDACRNDPLSDLSRSRATVKLESTTRPQTEAVPAGIVALFSCSAGQKAFEHPDLKHGIFFYQVIQALSGEAADATGSVSLNRFIDYVQKETQSYAQSRLDTLQVPQQKNDFSGSWILSTTAR